MEATEKPTGAAEAAGLKLCQLGHEVSVPAGARIVSQGEDPEFFYVIQSGRVRVFRETADRIQTNLTELEAGAYFGEVALVTGQPRSASVEAMEDATLIKVSKEEFDRLLDQNPQLARHIIQQLAGWLVAGDRRVEAEVVHQVKLRQLSWFDYVLMLGLSLVLSLVVNIYNDNRIPLIHGWGEKTAIPEIALNQAEEMYQKQQAIFVDARKSAFYSQQHIKDATNLPVILFDLMYPMFQFMVEQEGKDKTLVVYGGTFSRRIDIDLARMLKHKGVKNVVVLKDYAGWPKVFPLQEKAASDTWQPPPGVRRLPGMAAGEHLFAYLNSAHPAQPLPVGVLPGAAGGDLYFLRLEQNHAAGGLCLERGGLQPDARLGSEPVVSRPAVGRTGRGVVPPPGHPHPGCGHAHRRHERHLYCGTGQRHSASHAH